MASIFDKERYPVYDFIPKISDEQWDERVKGIRENTKEIDKELIGLALKFLSGKPGFAAILPELIKSYGIDPSDDMTNLLETIRKADQVALRKNPIRKTDEDN